MQITFTLNGLSILSYLPIVLLIKEKSYPTAFFANIFVDAWPFVIGRIGGVGRVVANATAKNPQADPPFLDCTWIAHMTFGRIRAISKRDRVRPEMQFNTYPGINSRSPMGSKWLWIGRSEISYTAIQPFRLRHLATPKKWGKIDARSRYSMVKDSRVAQKN
jgi:hypothetical protein